jgi:hypothetical protein
LDTAEIGEQGGDCFAPYFDPGLETDQVIEQSNNEYKKRWQEQLPDKMELLVNRKTPGRADEEENAQRPCIREHNRYTAYARNRYLVHFAVVVWPIHPTPTESESSEERGQQNGENERTRE